MFTQNFRSSFGIIFNLVSVNKYPFIGLILRYHPDLLFCLFSFSPLQEPALFTFVASPRSGDGELESDLRRWVTRQMYEMIGREITQLYSIRYVSIKKFVGIFRIKAVRFWGRRWNFHRNSDLTELPTKRLRRWYYSGQHFSAKFLILEV